MVTIKNNVAEYGGGVYSVEHSNIAFKGSSIVTIDSNEATLDGGGLYGLSTMTFHLKKMLKYCLKQ